MAHDGEHELAVSLIQARFRFKGTGNELRLEEHRTPLGEEIRDTTFEAHVFTVLYLFADLLEGRCLLLNASKEI